MKLWDVETGTLRGQVAPKGFVRKHDEELRVQSRRQADRDVLSRRHQIVERAKTRSCCTNFRRARQPMPLSVLTAVGWRLASNDKQSAGKIWNVETGEVKLTLASTGDKSVSVIFSPDGNLLATTNDKGVTLWDAQTGELTRNAGRGAVSGCVQSGWSDDGHRRPK